jgi:hypothetical protein
VSLRFFIIGGAILILTGLIKLVVRPRERHEVGLQRYINRGTIWSFFCVVVGVLAILVGLGIVPLARLD